MRKGLIYREVLSEIRAYLRQEKIKTTRIKQHEITTKFLENWRHEYLKNDEFLTTWLKDRQEKNKL